MHVGERRISRKSLQRPEKRTVVDCEEVLLPRVVDMACAGQEKACYTIFIADAGNKRAVKPSKADEPSPQEVAVRRGLPVLVGLWEEGPGLLRV